MVPADHGFENGRDRPRVPAGCWTNRSAASSTRRRTCSWQTAQRTGDPTAARQAFQTAMQGIDRLMKEEPLRLELREVVLPLVEQVDPALVPEYFYHVVAMRASIGNPRPVNGAFFRTVDRPSGLVRP